jgi:hypothetical protein
MSGFEIVGVSLAIFPFVIQGLSTIKALKDSEGTLKRLIRELKMEKCKFVNTSNTLLTEMGLSEETTKILKTGEGWGDTDFQKQLELHLGLEMAEAFTESVQALHASLKGLSQDVGLDGHRKVKRLRYSDARRKPPSSCNFADLSCQPSLRKLKAVLQRDSHNGVLQEIDKINRDLSQLTMQRMGIATTQKHTRPSAAVEYDSRIRSHAMRLYEAFQERFHVVCRSSASPCSAHNASLRLSTALPTSDTDRDPRLNVLFDLEGNSDTVPWRWFELDFKAVSCSQTQADLTVQIDGKNGNTTTGSDNQCFRLASRSSRFKGALKTMATDLVRSPSTEKMK